MRADLVGCAVVILAAAVVLRWLVFPSSPEMAIMDSTAAGAVTSGIFALADLFSGHRG